MAVKPERIAVTASAEGSEAVIAILDQGAGAGLGLAIVADILEAWGGSLALGPTTSGAMTATVRLPLTKR